MGDVGKRLQARVDALRRMPSIAEAELLLGDIDAALAGGQWTATLSRLRAAVVAILRNTKDAAARAQGVEQQRRGPQRYRTPTKHGPRAAAERATAASGQLALFGAEPTDRFGDERPHRDISGPSRLPPAPAAPSKKLRA